MFSFLKRFLRPHKLFLTFLLLTWLVRYLNALNPLTRSTCSLPAVFKLFLFYPFHNFTHFFIYIFLLSLFLPFTQGISVWPLYIRYNRHAVDDGLPPRRGACHSVAAAANTGQTFLWQLCGHTAQRQRERYELPNPQFITNLPQLLHNKLTTWINVQQTLAECNRDCYSTRTHSLFMNFCFFSKEKSMRKVLAKVFSRLHKSYKINFARCFNTKRNTILMRSRSNKYKSIKHKISLQISNLTSKFEFVLPCCQ